METIIVKTKKWGNSLGIRLPKEVVKENKIKAEEEIMIQIGKTNITKVKDIFGKLRFKESTKKIMSDIDKALDF